VKGAVDAYDSPAGGAGSPIRQMLLKTEDGLQPGRRIEKKGKETPPKTLLLAGNLLELSSLCPKGLVLDMHPRFLETLAF